MMRVVLPSNASMKHHPNNTLNSFTVELPQTLNFSEGQWECGLSEIQFFKSWYNVKGAYITVTAGAKQYSIPIIDGYYEDGRMLVDAINKNIAFYNPEVKDYLSFSYSEISRTCNIHIHKSMDLYIEMPKSLEKMLGFDENEIDSIMLDAMTKHPRSGFVIYGQKPMKLITIYNIMVYSNVVQHSVVGDIQTSLLRSVPVEPKHWRYQCTQISKTQYIPISQKQIRSISIYLYSDYGEPIPFTDGKTIVTLEFRRVKPVFTY